MSNLSIKVNCTNLDSVKEAFRIANNGIYFDTKGDYLDALYEICKLLNPNMDEANIGKNYIK